MPDRWRLRLVTAAAALQGLMLLWLVVFFLIVVPSAAPPLTDPALAQGPWFLTASAALSGLALIAWLLVRRQPRHGLLPALVGSALASVGLWVLQSWVTLAHRNEWPGAGVAFWATGLVWMVGIAGFLMFLLRFPTGRPLNARWRRFEILMYSQVGALAAYVAFVPKMPGTPADYPSNPLGIGVLSEWEPVFWALFALLGAEAIAGLVGLGIRFHRGGQVERQQLRWVVAASSVLLVTALIGARPAPMSVALLLLVGSIGVAVLRYRLWDLGLVVRRTILYAVLSAILLVGYVGSVVALRKLISVDLVPELIVTALIAVVALPLRGILQRTMDKLLFGRRRDPYAVVRAIGRRLSDGSEPALPAVLGELTEALRLPGAAIELPDGTVAAAHGSTSTVGARIPLLHHGHRVGELVASRRHPAEPLTGTDIRLLGDVAQQLGVVVQSVVLDEAVRRSQNRLTEIREAERARLRRDLHDEMGPLLGAATLRVQAARNLLGASAPDLVRVEGILACVASDVDRALAEVQRIITDLRPGALAEQGLLGALREHTDAWAGRLRLQVDLPGQLPVLDPATEVAAYRIALEGLRNAERHSGGTTATLRVGMTGSDLEIVVVDDGHGLTTPSPTGVGLGSMRERARQVGGTLRLEPGDCGGLRIRSRLPSVAAR